MGGMRPDRRDVYLCLCLTDCVAVCLYFCVNCVRVEFYLHANRPVILHKAHALIQAIQRRTLCKSHINNWSSSLNILSKIQPSKKKETLQKVFLCILSLPRAVIHFPPLTGNRRRALKGVAALVSEHEISELCCRGTRSTEHHPLTSAESIRPLKYFFFSSILYIW